MPNGSPSSGAEAKAFSPEVYRGYQPIDPLPAETVMVYNKTAQEMQPALWASMLDENSVVRNLLPLQSAEVSVSQTDVSGELGYLTASVSGQNGTYIVTMDYMKYRVEDVSEGADGSGESLGTARIGVGLRIKAVVQTTEVGLNLGSLIAIGAEARRGTLRGGISVDVIGIDSPDVTNLIPLTSEIDQTSIQGALQALASIKTKISEDDTRLTPHVVAIRQAKCGAAQRIKDSTAIARERGIARARSNREKMNEILAAVAPSRVLDNAKWEALVEKASLPDSDKTSLKTLTNYEDVEGWLESEVPSSTARVLSALHDRL